jgi:Aspartyl protease
MRVEFNRPLIDLELHSPDGKKRNACTWVDTGGGSFILAETLARELKLEFGEADENLAPTLQEPDVYLGGMKLEVSGAYPCVQLHSSWIETGFPAEAFIPGRVLNKYHAVFDYPGKTFTLAESNSVKAYGTKFSTPVSGMGFPRIELEIQGERYGFLLDTGASYTMLSETVIKKLAVQHAIGAVGAANMGYLEKKSWR